MTINPPQVQHASWEVRAAEKRARCADAIPKPWRLPSHILDSLKTPLETNKNDLVSLDIPRRSGILSDIELDITESYNVSSLLAKLADGTFTAVQVVTAFSKRAAIAQQLTNCLTETFFDQAELRARQLDELREGGKLAGPLHGLPISLKDTFHVPGTQATIGLVAFLDEFSKTTSPLVEILLSLGAVPYVKTNVPQTMMTADSQNNVFGRTLNPRNTALGAGGSSGGEGALVAFRGSPIGVGTDIGGSIRIPALCCGTYGFKPTAGRIPYGGQRGCSNPGLKFILACAGPLANDMKSLEIFTKSVIDARPADLDSTAIDVPWRNISAPSGKKLRLGILPEDPPYPLQPPIRHAISQAVAKLRAEGHTLVELDPKECLVSGINGVAWGLFSLDKTASRIVTDAGEPCIPSRQRITDELERLKGDFLPDLTGLSDLDKLSTLNIKRAEVIESWRKVWQSHSLDAVIGPAAQNTAVQHDLYGVPPYTCFLNVLNYPACVIPFGSAKPIPGEEFTLNPDQAGPPYDAELTEGAPCSIQVFTSSMRDEECIGISSIIDNVLNG
ncbi:hypothetical protein CDV36_000226 [Fusarium kuroshium]|uniref:amidase n=1 Tax=Fusarium kuroshium TaxID=2010991 RepID=A0A3M2SR64_9HYPO|nr:hypothetical protein CDV36_000226 [Fusarium kuroshium]